MSIDDQNNPDRLREAEDLWSESDDELYARLVTVPQDNALHQDLVRRGRELYAAGSLKMKEIICKNQAIRSMWSNDKGFRRTQLVCTISDLFVSSILGMPVMVLTTLIVREGLDVYCRIEWGSQDDPK